MPGTHPAIAAGGDELWRVRLRGVPGLDADAGLGRLRGKLPSYLRLLRVFVATRGGDAERIEALVRAGELAEARAIAHALKGAAAMLGASALQSCAAALETSLGESRPPESLLADCAALAAAHAALIAALAALPDTAA